ncbi:cell envelope integrity protein CreD [Flavobacterium oreochromis]|uniref:Cell envelope integrity protein CreD n=2 Tax=Flavobacterium TaxID=237 RepID=A0A246G960_9FLAO|nr:cell envelope integrity protein CreD [Flavobacterium oreochromis]OWP75640.1 cell envelope integrity protein CreD [Flavobacterium oreochromis]OWP75885.1 cell envelope integrity protein CreD [Flavobacterium oreochromis]POR20845.1 cell envelope integrity protein CreD [Flavobacterium columnare]
METQHQESKIFFQSTTAKMAMIGILTLVLLIPLQLSKNLIEERSIRKQEVSNEVSDLWGKDIYFYGPILKIPYKTYQEVRVTNPTNKTNIIERKININYVFFFPENYNVKTFAKKNTSLKRGIYNNVVYTAYMNFKGNFSQLNFEKLNIKEADLLWNEASIIVKTTNLKSIKSDLNINLNNKTLKFESKTEDDNFYGTLETNSFDYTNFNKNGIISFNFKMEYNGSNSIKYIPIGKKTNVTIDSDWKSPSFEGAFAANDESKIINEKGFHVDWKILSINRSFSQQYTNKIPLLNEYAFGVKLIEPVDEYQQNERASKYGFLVIGLTFLIFFLIQSISKINIHIFQYLMIGLALIMFYTLLISITEHSSFSLAYIIAGLAVVTMISLYSKSILNLKFSTFISLSLISLYTFIYVIIQLESYALLVGSIGLFTILGLIMYVSRNIDWKNN